MVVIRLARGGSHDRPFFNVVVADKLARRDGRFIEKLGFLNRLASANTEGVRIDLARVDYWLSKGAQMTDTVAALVKTYRKSAAAAA